MKPQLLRLFAAHPSLSLAALTACLLFPTALSANAALKEVERIEHVAGPDAAAAYSLMMNPLTGRLCVGGFAAFGSPNLQFVDASAGVVAHGETAQVFSTGKTIPLARDERNGVFYVATGNSIAVYDLATEQFIRSMSVTMPTNGNKINNLAVNSATNTLYATTGAFDNPDASVHAVLRINPADGSVAATIPVGVGPNGVAVNERTNRIYVNTMGPNSFTNSTRDIYIIDGATNAVSNVTVTVPAKTSAGYTPAIAVNPDTNKVYATLTGFAYSGQAGDYDRLIVIDGATGSVTKEINVHGNAPLLTGVNGVAVDRATNRIYVCNNGGYPLQVIDGTSDSLLAPIQIFDVGHDSYGSQQTAIETDAKTNRVYVLSGYAPARVFIIDGSTNTWLANSTVPLVDRFYLSNAVALTQRTALDSGLKKLYTISDETMTLMVFDTVKGAAKTAISFSGLDRLGAVVVNSTTHRLYVTSPFYSTVFVIDTQTDKVLTTIAVSNNPRELAIDEARNKVYAVVDGAVAVIDGKTNTIEPGLITGIKGGTGPGTIGRPPSPIAVNPVTNRVYCIGRDYNNPYQLYLSEIDPAAGAVVASIALGTGGETPAAIAIDTAANKIYTTAIPTGGGTDNAGLSVIDGPSRSVIFVAPPANRPFYHPDLEFDATHHRLYIASNNGVGSFIGYYDVNSGSYTAALGGGSNASITLDAVSTRLYLTYSAPDSAYGGTTTYVYEEEKGRPLNISTRLQIQQGDNILIGGFIITGPSYYTKRVLIRGLGPSLRDSGVIGALNDPLLELHGGPNVVTNDNWKQGDVSQIPEGFAPKYEAESVIVADLNPGAYTAIVKGAHGETGIGLAEIYDLDSTSNTKLANISTRGFVQGGDNVLIGGFIVGDGDAPTVLIRAMGPSLVDSGVQNAMADPVLELHDANGNTTFNDNWADTQAAEINSTGIAPVKDKEAAIYKQLTPGAYTSVVRGKNGTTGIAVVEVYCLN